MRIEIMRGSGGVQWNAGAWFGSQCGATIWMLIWPIVFWMKTHSATALLGILPFCIVNMAGLTLWSRRDRMEPYPAVQLLIGVIGAATLLFLLILDLSGQLKVFFNTGVNFDWSSFATTIEDTDLGNRTGRLIYLILLLFPVLMLLMHWVNRRGSRKNEETV